MEDEQSSFPSSPIGLQAQATKAVSTDWRKANDPWREVFEGTAIQHLFQL